MIYVFNIYRLRDLQFYYLLILTKKITDGKEYNKLNTRFFVKHELFVREFIKKIWVELQYIFMSVLV